jgi:CRP/FNR family cyclic AMP-dependent transcriptional regulator
VPPLSTVPDLTTYERVHTYLRLDTAGVLPLRRAYGTRKLPPRNTLAMPKVPPRMPERPLDSSALLGSPLLAALSKEDLQALVKVARLRSWDAEQVLFQRGDPGDGIYAIVSGEVRIVLEGTNGTEVTVRLLTTGDVFGEFSVLDGAPRSATAIANTRLRALLITPAAFDAWLAAHPAAARPMLAQLAQRVRTTNDQLAEIGLLEVEARIARRLWQRFVSISTGRPGPGTRIPLNQRELAAEIGVTRESVNKHLARWKARGALAINQGSVVLLDPDALYLGTGHTIA